MSNDNPAKYEKEGGLHVERLTVDDVLAEGLDPAKVWIVIGIKEGDEVKVAIIPGDYALKVADAITKLATMKI